MLYNTRFYLQPGTLHLLRFFKYEKNPGMFKADYEELINSNVIDAKHKKDKVYNTEEKTPLRRSKLHVNKDKATDTEHVVTPKPIPSEEIPSTLCRDHPLNPRKR